VKSSQALALYREQIREIVAKYRATNPLVFGSALHRNDTEESDLDLLIDPAEGTTLFDIGGITDELQELLDVQVDVLTPLCLPVKFRDRVLAEARPV
jgi:predicted nucleotidyltransferase